MKISVITTDYNNILEYSKIGADSFIFGLKNYSSGYNNEITIEDIKEIREFYTGELFIAINKNIFNRELDELESIMKELDELNISGILFYDLSILSIKKRLGLSVPLVWNQTHMVTNYNTCNYYYDKGCEYGVISSEITLEEINEIKNNTKMKLFLNVLGYQIMGYSRRHLLDNYFKSTDTKRDNNTYIIKNNNEDYIIQEEENGNALYYGKPLNGSVIVNDVNVDYLILNDNNFDKDVFIKTLILYKKLVETKDENIIKEIDDLVGDNRGFFFTKTIYKVKKNG